MGLLNTTFDPVATKRAATPSPVPGFKNVAEYASSPNVYAGGGHDLNIPGAKGNTQLWVDDNGKTSVKSNPNNLDANALSAYGVTPATTAGTPSGTGTTTSGGGVPTLPAGGNGMINTNTGTGGSLTYQSSMNPGNLSPVAQASASSASPTKWNVDPNQTVESRIGGIVNQDSPLMDMARTNAEQQMAARGLNNSSMAVTAGQNAVYSAALPIASQDAGTFANAGKSNADNANQASIVNAQLATNTAIANAGAQNQRELAKLNNSFQLQMQGADTATKMQLQGLQDATQTKLANIQADYQTAISTNSSVGNAYSTMMGAIANTVNDPNMDGPSKANAINLYTGNFRAQANLIGSVNGIDLTNLLNFGTASA